MSELRLGIGLWSQATSWRPMLETARLVDRLGYDYLWTWDHHYAPFGDPHQSILEGWSVTSAWAAATERCRVGLLVAASPWHSPALYAKMVMTLDHITDGRAVLGIGGGWWESEAAAFGVDFASGVGERLDRLDSAVSIISRLLEGDEVTTTDGPYRVDHLKLRPLPVQDRIPILIGGGGERKTLRTVARYAHMWNAFGTVEELRHKTEVLAGHCAAVGRDPLEIDRSVECKIIIRDSEDEARRVWAELSEANRMPTEVGVDTWLGTPDQIAERITAFRAIGFDTMMSWMPAPYDRETIERLIGEVKPAVDNAGPPARV
jgi:alkanesulfonate monooxygenase SsuD/methylene tetrahydromethanopterin reductase-like flavin-dependent oxidoreductase (luciferase family)